MSRRLNLAVVVFSSFLLYPALAAEQVYYCVDELAVSVSWQSDTQKWEAVPFPPANRFTMKFDHTKNILRLGGKQAYDCTIVNSTSDTLYNCTVRGPFVGWSFAFNISIGRYMFKPDNFGYAMNEKTRSTNLQAGRCQKF